MRGITTYNSLFDTEIIEIEKPERRGRSSRLIEARNEFLLYRIYFKSKIQRKIYPDALSELENEIHISQVMIQKIIQAHHSQLSLIKKDQPSVKLLREKYPHYVW